MAIYRNPAAAISECRERGLDTPGELYSCAIGKAPQTASDKWYAEAKRLARSSALAGARRRRRKRRR